MSLTLLEIVIVSARSIPTSRADFVSAPTTHIDRNLVTAIAGEDPTPEASLRATLLFAALMLGAVGGESPLPIGGDQATRTAAARAVALDLLAPLGAP